MHRLALSMIVKNESHIILECLNSVYKQIDYWVIVDTGSTDGTQDIIQNFFKEKNIPGELIQSDWKGFGPSRTEALNYVKGKAVYAFMIDADDYLQGSFVLPDNNDIDSYALRLGREEFSWWRNQIFKVDSDWQYLGILHEYAHCKGKEQPLIMKLEGNYRVVARTMGARNLNVTPIEKYSKDAETLEEALKTEPDNSRYQFYLGQSYFDSQQWEKAIVAYMRRVEMGGWAEEVYYSLYRIAVAKAMLERPWGEVLEAFLMSFNARPIRAEPLYHIAQVYRTKLNMPATAFLFAKAAAEMPFPANDILFVPDAVYNFAALDEVAATAFYAGHPQIGYNACQILLKQNKIPKSEIPRIQNNLKQYEQILANLQQQQQQHQQKMEMYSKVEQKEPPKKKKFKERK